MLKYEGRKLIQIDNNHKKENLFKKRLKKIEISI